MDYNNFFIDIPDLEDSPIHSFRFPTKSIRFYPVEIQKLEDNHPINKSSSLYSLLYGSTNINERVSTASSIPLSSSENLFHPRNYTLLGCCSLKPNSHKRLSPLKIPAANAKLTDSFKFNYKHHEHHSSVDADFNSSDLYVYPSS